MSHCFYLFDIAELVNVRLEQNFSDIQKPWILFYVFVYCFVVCLNPRLLCFAWRGPLS